MTAKRKIKKGKETIWVLIITVALTHNIFSFNFCSVPVNQLLLPSFTFDEITAQRSSVFYPKSHRKLWRKECLNPDLSFLWCHAAVLNTEACFSVIFVPTGLCNRREVWIEIRKPDRWGRPPELPLLGAMGMFAFLGPTLSKGPREGLCPCSEHPGVITRSCLAKECGSWGTEASPRWFDHV